MRKKNGTHIGNVRQWGMDSTAGRNRTVCMIKSKQLNNSLNINI